jgi:hypothetical protein
VRRKCLLKKQKKIKNEYKQIKIEQYNNVEKTKKNKKRIQTNKNRAIQQCGKNKKTNTNK